jgi:hypothetical protein
MEAGITIELKNGEKHFVQFINYYGRKFEFQYDNAMNLTLVEK